jgi:hypothetical protein
MKYLGDIREDVRTYLQDNYATGVTQIWKDEELDQAIESALRDLSSYSPRELIVTAVSDGTKKIDLEDITDTDFDLDELIGVVKAEYDVDQDPEQFRNVTRFANIITININTAPTSGDDIYFYCNMQHYLTDNESSLTAFLESILVIGAAAIAAANKATSYYNQGNKLIADFTTIATAIGNMTARINQAITDIGDGRTEVEKLSAIIDEAKVELEKIAPEVDQAVDDLDSGRDLIESIDTAKQASNYASYAQTGVNNARGYLQSATGLLQEAQTREGNNNAYLRQAGEQLTAANSYMNQANGYIQNARMKLNIAQSGTAIHNWSTARQQEFRRKLNSQVNTRKSEVYTPY